MDASNSEHVTLFPEGRLHFADLNWFETLKMPAVQGFVDHMLRFPLTLIKMGHGKNAIPD